jgi:hypothetical protein
MKKILLLLMMVASVASAQDKQLAHDLEKLQRQLEEIQAQVPHPRSDAELKALIVGTWNSKDYDAKPVTYQEDGTIAGDVRMKWSIKDGVLDEIDTPETEGVPRDQWQGKSGGYWYNYLILFLNKHDLLLWDTKYKTFTYMYR